MYVFELKNWIRPAPPGAGDEAIKKSTAPLIKEYKHKKYSSLLLKEKVV